MTDHDRPPLAVIALASVGGAFVLAPIVGLLTRAPWSHLDAQLFTSEARTALRLSLVCSLWATAIAVAIGTPLAWVLARSRLPGRRVLRAIVLVPLVLPPVVGGVGLLLAFGRHGMLGGPLDRWFGVRLAFTTAGAALAEAFVALPFFVLSAEAAFRAADRGLEDAARTLGARPWTVLRRVTLPAAAPALGAGLALAWARALGEYGATVTFAGTTPGRTATLPLQVVVSLESGHLDGAIALSVALLVVSVVVLVAARGRWWPVR